MAKDFDLLVVLILGCTLCDGVPQTDISYNDRCVVEGIPHAQRIISVDALRGFDASWAKEKVLRGFSIQRN